MRESHRVAIGVSYLKYALMLKLRPDLALKYGSGTDPSEIWIWI